MLYEPNILEAAPAVSLTASARESDPDLALLRDCRPAGRHGQHQRIPPQLWRRGLRLLLSYPVAGETGSA